MKNFTLPILAAAFLVNSAGAQKLTILPLAGAENPLTRVTLNDLQTFTPLQNQLSPSLGVRIDYKVLKNQGPYIGISTARSAVAYSFASAENSLTDYQAAIGKMQAVVQGGWQFSTKPIYFKKQPAPQKVVQPVSYRSSSSRCGMAKQISRCGTQNKMQAIATPKDERISMRILPSAGIAVNPFRQETIVAKSAGANRSDTYNAGNFTTAITTGVGFEFATSKARLLTLQLNYFKGLGSNPATLVTEQGLKTTTTQISSAVSGWSASLGIPISLGKKPAAKPQPQILEAKKKQCSFIQYKSNCRRTI